MKAKQPEIRDERPLLTPMEVAVRLGMDKTWQNPARQILRMAREGLFVAIPIGRRRRIRPDSVDRFIRGQ